MRIQSLRPAAWPVIALAIAFLAANAIGVDAQGDARERTLFVSAVDKDGAPIDGLSINDFIVREDGARREVLRVSRAIEPMDIALLVDTSASSSDLIPQLRDGVRRFITAMLPAGVSQPHSIALVSIAARPTILVDYTSNTRPLLDGAGRLFTDRISGITLLDALVEVSRGLERREATRAVIVPVITDGIEFSNRYYRDVLEAMTRAGAGLHAVTVGTFSVSDDDAIRNRAFTLEEGPKATGGQRKLLLTTNAVPAALDRLAAELQSQYKVVYGRPQSLIPPEKLEVSASRAGITMRAMPIRGQKPGV